MFNKIFFKKLAVIGLAVLAFGLNACDSNTNPLTDKSKHKYHPQNRDELVKLLKDEDIKLDTIDTSKITDMSFLFANLSDDKCNDLKKIEKLEPYIEHCKNNAKDRKDFSGIETWDTSNVIDMSNMFDKAYDFNQPLNSWDVSKVTNMRVMFARAENFNQPLDNWDVSKVIDMGGMFAGASSFNQPLNSWNVSNVTNMSLMFLGAENFNQSLNSWNVSKVTDMRGMFFYAKNFNQPLDKWDVSKVANTQEMFYNSPLASNPPKWYFE